MGEGGGAHRLAAVAGPVAPRERAETGRIGRGEDAAIERGGGEQLRVVPQAGADELLAGEVHPRCRQRLEHLRHRVGGIRQEHRVGLHGRAGDAPRGFRVLAGRVALQPDDASADDRHGLAEGGLDHRAIGIVRDQPDEGAPPDGGGVAHAALDVGLRQEAEQVDALRGDVGVGGEADQRHAALPGDLSGGGDRMGEERADDGARALVQRLLGGRLRPRPGAAVILDDQPQPRAGELRQRQIRRVLQRLRHRRGIPAGPQRQNQADRRAGAGRGIAAGRQGRRGQRGLRRRDVGARGAGGERRRAGHHQEAAPGGVARPHARRPAFFIDRPGEVVFAHRAVSLIAPGVRRKSHARQHDGHHRPL